MVNRVILDENGPIRRSNRIDSSVSTQIAIANRMSTKIKYLNLYLCAFNCEMTSLEKKEEIITHLAHVSMSAFAARMQLFVDEYLVDFRWTLAQVIQY